MVPNRATYHIQSTVFKGISKVTTSGMKVLSNLLEEMKIYAINLQKIFDIHYDVDIYKIILNFKHGAGMRFSN